MANPVQNNNGIDPRRPIRLAFDEELDERTDAAAQLRFVIPAPGFLSPFGTQHSVAPHARVVSEWDDSGDEMDTDFSETLKRSLESGQEIFDSFKRQRVDEDSARLLGFPTSSFQTVDLPTPPAPPMLSAELLAELRRGFEVANTHKDLIKARGGKILDVPKTPTRGSSSDRMRAAFDTPCIEKKQEVEGFIARGQPFELEIAPGNKVQIQQISFLAQGCHSEAYKCVLADGSLWVLKISREVDPVEVLNQLTNQLYLYARNKQHPYMQHHIATHANFEPHVEAVILMALREYVEKNLKGLLNIAVSELSQAKSPKEVLNELTNQLYLYTKNKKDKPINKNFEPYVEEVNKILEKLPIENLIALREYVEKNLNGFLFVPFISRERIDDERSYESATDPAWDNISHDPIWQQIQGMLATFDKHGLCNDIRRSNVGVDANGTVLLFDLFERDDTDCLHISELVNSFSDNEAAKKWLTPQ